MNKTKKLKEIIKNKNGITLVALVVTIVILLILAGISLNMVLGENGLVRKSNEARIKTRIASDEEAIGLAVTSVMLDGDLSLEKLQTELNKTRPGEFTISEADGIITVSFNGGKSYTVNSDGTFRKKEPITLAQILEFIDDNDVCMDDFEAIEFTEKLKYLGYYYGTTESHNTEWGYANVYRCSIDSNIYIVGSKINSEQIEMEQVNWDGTMTLDNEGTPITLSTSFGTYQSTGFIELHGPDDTLREDYGYSYLVSISPPFNEACILKYNEDGKLIKVEWYD